MAAAPPAEAPRRKIVGDLWGGLAATLVALPASIAFGVAVYAPLGGGAGAGALAGLLGATALGTIAPLLGGTPRLISAPCAPAVAVMGGFALHMAALAPDDPMRVMVLMTLVGLIAAAIQVGLGLARAGTIIKYIPYPVVTGYMSGVGLVIVRKQLPALLGLPKGTSLTDGLTHPSLWQASAVIVAATTIAAMVLAPRVTKAVPAAILGLAAGLVAYLILALIHPELQTLAGNALVIGPLEGGASMGDAVTARFEAFGDLRGADLALALGPALTLAVVLSLDTLKTAVVVDALTGSQHDSNRELFGQGVANAVSATIGGMPGAGTSGATLVNVASGAQTKWSAVFEGGLVLIAFLTLSGIIGWAPLAALAGILTVVAVRMFDWKALGWVRRSATVLDFVVVIAVIAVAVGVDLITASAVGVGLSILLFIRNEARGDVIRRKLDGNQIFSKRRRLPAEVAVLTEHGGETVVVELADSLFFGTTDQLRRQLKDDLATRRTIIFDLRRVDALDLTAAHIFEQMFAQLHRRDARAVLCNLPRALSGRTDVPRYLRELGLLDDGPASPQVFASTSDALAWAEDRLLREHGCAVGPSEGSLELTDMAMFAGRKAETMAAVAECVERRTVAAGGYVFRRGDTGDELFFVRAGAVRISLPVDDKSLHVASIGRGDFFGEIVFLDGGARTADATAETDVELFAISRRRFDAVAAAHPRLAQAFFASIAQTLALRLRRADAEITTLEAS